MIDFVMTAKAAVKNAAAKLLDLPFANANANASGNANASTFKRWALFGMLAVVGTAAQADITPSKTFLPGSWNGVGVAPAPLSAPINQGDEAWLEVTVINSSAGIVTALAGTDPLPSGLLLAANPSPFAAPTCGSSTAANFTAVPGTSSLSFTGLQVPAASGAVVGSCSVYVRVKVYGALGAAAGAITTMNNVIPIGNITGIDGGSPVSNSSAAAQSIQVTKLADPSISKGFAPSPVPMGGTSIATITITNNAAADVDLTSLVENLPATLTATTTPTVQCAGSGTPSAATNMGGSFPNLTFPANTKLAASSTCTISFTVRAQSQNGNGYTANNNIPANGLGNSRLLNSPAANANLTVESPLLTSKSFTPSTAAANQLVTMTITLQNRSGFAISAGSLSDTFPGAVSGGGLMTVRAPGGASLSGGGAGCAAASAFAATTGAGSFSASGLTIPANSFCSYTVPVTVDNDGVYNNVTSATTYTSADSNVGTRTNSPASATLTAYDQITASKSAQDPRDPNNGANVVAPGTRIVYRVTVSNYTSSAISDVQVTDPLPLEVVSGAQVLYLTSSVSTPTSVTGSGCSGPTSVTGTFAVPIFNGISVPAGTGANPGTCVLEFWVQIPTNWPVGTGIVNSIPATSITYAGGTKSLQGGAVVATSPTVNRLTIGKSVLPNTVFQGDTAVVTVTLNNNSYNAMTAAQFNDAALFGASNSVRNASPTNPSTTCSGTPAYTYSAGGSSFAASGLTVPARGNCVVTWRVVGINPGGPYTNTLPAANVSGTVDSGAGPVTFYAVGDATTDMTVNSVLNVSKSFSPATVGGAGGVSRVSITLQNVGNAALTRVAAVDNLPSGLTVNNPANASTTCGGASVVNPLPGATAVNLTGGTLYANSTCLVQFDVVSSTNTPAVNTVNPNDVTADNGVFNASPASATLNKFASPGVNISKAFNPITLPSVGAVSRLTVNVQNNAPGAVLLTNAGFVDNMPAGMVLSATPNPVSNCPGASMTAVAGASSFAMANATLAANSSCLVAVNVTLVSSGTFQNTLPARVLTNDQNVSNADPFSTSLATLATLGVEKAFNPVAALPNTPVQLKIRVINSLNLSFTNLSVTDNLPAGMTVSSPSALSTTCTGAAESATSSTISLTGASLPAASGGVAATCEITVLVQAASFGAFTNTIPAGGVTGLSSLGTTVSNLDPARAVFRTLQPLSLTKAFANANRIPGQSDTLTITISNPNASAINNVSLIDNLPTNAYLANPPAQSTTCTSSTITENGAPLTVPVNVGATAGGTSLRISGAQIPANGSCTFQADVLSNQIGTFVNRIPDGAITSFEGVTNPAPAVAQFTTFDPPVLGKQFIPVQISSGGNAKLRIVLGNTNSSALTLSSNLVDNLPTAPGAMTLAATPIDTAATTCTLGSVNASAGGNTVTYNSGATIPSGGCVIVVNVTATAEGTYNNVIPGGGLATNGGSNPVPATASVLVSNTLASISGRVYRDNNNNGIPDGAEAGIDAQVIELLDSTGTTVVATTTTDSLGNYAFLGLTPGTYRVREPAQPAGTLNGTTSVGTIAGAPSGTGTAVGTTPSLISAITVAGGQSSIDNNFGELVPSRLAGKVFLDPNNNGTQQGGEPGIAGVVMTLSGSNDLGPLPAGITATTAADGSYSFTGLRPGSYTITEGAQPAGTANGITTAAAVNQIGSGTAAPGGVSGTATAPTVLAVTAPAGTSRIGVNGGTGVPITLPSNAESLNNDFAEIPTSRSVSGRIFTDFNDDGAFNTTDTAIGGQLLTLSGLDASGSPVNRTVNANADGTYSFANLPESNGAGYTVSYATAGSPAGNTLGKSVVGSTGGTGAATGANRTVLSGIPLTGLLASSGNNNFTQRPPGVISGRVYLDANNNGLFEPAPGGNDAPLSGVQMVLSGTDYGLDGVPGGGDDVVLPAVGAVGAITINTAPDGTYSFTNLRAGNYSVVEPTQPANSANGITTAGTVTSIPAGGTPGVATGLTTAPSAVNNIALPAGGISPNNNFGEIPTSSAITGFVWKDTNNDGLLNYGELGIGSVRVELTGTDLAGQAVTRFTDTLPDGSYAFNSLPPGTYTVTEPVQPAGTLNGTTVKGSTTGTATPVATLPSAIAGITIGIAQISSANNFGEVPVASISGRVYNDNNNNGSIDTGETGIANVPVILDGVNDLGAVIRVELNTLTDGTYNFPSLRPGTYRVTEPTQPANTVNGITSVGTVGGVALGAATPVTDPVSVISAIVLGAGAQSVNNNFGEIGDSPDMLVSKSHSPAKFTVNNVGTYTFTVRNAGQRNSTGTYTVSDRLPPGLTLASTPSGTGWTCTGAAGASSFSCTGSTVVNAGAINAQTFEAKIAVSAAAAAASPAQNVVLVDGGGEYDARRPTTAERDAFNNNPLALPVCDPAVLHNVCRDPTPVQLAASLSGTVWYDIGTSLKVLDAADRRLPNWKVELVNPATGQVVATTTTGTDGSYKLVDLIPGMPLSVRFRDPSSNVVFGYPVNGDLAPGSSGVTCDATAALANGTASSCVQRSPSTELAIVLAPGQNLAQQSLPVDPSGVVYDSTTRQPVPGSVVTLTPTGVCTGYDPATSLVNIAAGGYTVAGSGNNASTSMTVGADGFYQFLFAPAAPPSCAFTLSVTPPAGYTFASTVIPAETTTLTAPGAAGSTFAVQPQASAPNGVPGSATTYYLALNSGSAAANIIHNHIPIDPAVPTALALTKTGDKAQAEVGDSVLYTVTVRQVSGPALNQVTVHDRLPAGFTLIRGTVRVNGVSVADPVGGLGPNLGFNLGPIGKNAQIALTYRVRVGVGSQQGDGTNRAKAFGCGTPAGCLTPTFAPIAGAVPSNEGQHRVKVTGGVFTAQACVVGKIFVDCNNNHVQDPEELGIPGVRLYLEDGSYVVSDSEGKYSQCDISPKSHVLKVDPLTLPRGSRLTTSSNRNLGDAGSLFIDLKNGELHRADFIEGSCSNTVLEQVKARRSQGEIRSVETEKKKGPALKFESKPRGAPQEATDSANQPIVKPRVPAPGGGTDIPRSESERNIPVWQLPLNAPSSAVQGGSNAR